MSRNTYRRTRRRCASCGEDQGLSYIVWEDQPLCSECFPKAVGEYASRYPFEFANELRLDIIRVPEEELYFDDER